MPARRDKFGNKVKRDSVRKNGSVASVYGHRFRQNYDDKTAYDVYIPEKLTKTTHRLRRQQTDVAYIRDLIELCGTDDAQALFSSRNNHLQYTYAKISKLVQDLRRIDEPSEIDCNQLIFQGNRDVRAYQPTYAIETMSLEAAKRIQELKSYIK